MTREEYINGIKGGNAPIEGFYDYYNTFNKKEELSMEYEEFFEMFNQWIREGRIKDNITYVPNANIVQKIKQYYDEMFKIMYVHDKNGQLIGLV